MQDQLHHEYLCLAVTIHHCCLHLLEDSFALYIQSCNTLALRTLQHPLSAYHQHMSTAILLSHYLDLLSRLSGNIRERIPPGAGSTSHRR